MTKNYWSSQASEVAALASLFFAGLHPESLKRTKVILSGFAAGSALQLENASKAI